MTEPKKTLEVGMYKNYGIAEWHEKCQILRVDEQHLILAALKEGEETGLVKLAKLPFPKFVEAYFSKLPNYDFYFKDPETAYKLYFFPDSCLRLFTECIRHPETSVALVADAFKIPNPHRQQDLAETLLSLRLEQLNTTISAAERKRNLDIKFIYLTQYLDRAECQRLGLSMGYIATLQDGYDIESKLDSLNPVARQLMILYLGLHGEARHTTYELDEMFGVYRANIQTAINFLLPLFRLSPALFNVGIGYKSEEDKSNCMHEYKNRTYRSIDISLETKYYYSNLGDEEKSILDSINKNKRLAYLAAKRMYADPEVLSRNLVLSIADAKWAIDATPEELKSEKSKLTSI